MLCEPSINTVKHNKPKVLTGLNQKVSDETYGLGYPVCTDKKSPVDKWEPNPLCLLYGTWKPHIPPLFTEGKSIVRKTDRSVSRGSRKKQRPGRNDLDTE